MQVFAEYANGGEMQMMTMRKADALGRHDFSGDVDEGRFEELCLLLRG